MIRYRTIDKTIDSGYTQLPHENKTRTLEGDRIVSLAAKISELRKRKGESLQNVADAVGASKAHIWELETGKSKNPSLDLLVALAKHFKVPVAQLVGEDPTASDDDENLVVMYRELKGLEPQDWEIIEGVIQTLKNRQSKST